MTKGRMNFSYGRAARARKPYQYSESGLDNVWLTNGFDHQEYDGEVFTRVRDPDALHRAIAKNLIQRQGTLDGKELRFVRKEMDITQAELARLMDVTSQTVARWEKDEVAIPRTTDLLLRAFMLCHLQGSVDVCALAERLSAADQTFNAEIINLTHEDGAWHPQRKLEKA